MATVAVERKKLYEQVWSVPASRLAVLYGISDVGLAKACKRYNIPRPTRGYWARVAAGQRVRRPALPQPSRGDELVYLKGWDMPDEAVQQLVKEGASPEKSPLGDADAGRHQLASLTQEKLLESKPDAAGLVTVSSPGMDIQVSPVVAERAVAVLDALIKRWEARGGSVVVADAGEATAIGTTLRIGPDGFGVRLVEHVDETKPITDPTRLTGRLSLIITGDESRQFRRRWWDTKSQRLERMLGPLTETLANAITVKRQERLDAECVSRQMKIVETNRNAASRDVSREFYWRQELMQRVDRWHDAQRIRAYLQALKTSIDAGQSQPADEKQFTVWYDWATKFADSIDPIAGGALPEGKPPERRNVNAAELDLTSATRAAVQKLAVANTDGLWKQKQEAVRSACEGKFGPVWNEITRVLEGLWYDVSKREHVSEWW